MTQLGTSQLLQASTDVIALAAVEDSFFGPADPIKWRWSTQEGLFVESIAVSASLQDGISFKVIKEFAVTFDFIDINENAIVLGTGTVSVPAAGIAAVKFSDSPRQVPRNGQVEYYVDKVFGINVPAFSATFEALPNANFKLFFTLLARTYQL